jgi:hypothetical protein
MEDIIDSLLAIHIEMGLLVGCYSIVQARICTCMEAQLSICSDSGSRSRQPSTLGCRQRLVETARCLKQLRSIPNVFLLFLFSQIAHWTAFKLT